MLDLSQVPRRATRHEGVYLHFLRRDAETGDTTVLIRMEPGRSYPAHRHRGPEEVFILQGGYTDSRGSHRAGDYVLNEPGSAHHPKALTDPPEDCVMLAFARGGIELIREP